MEAPSTASAAAAGASVTAASHGSDLRSLPTVSPSPPKVANPDSAWSGTGAATEESAAEFGSDGKMASVVPQEDAGEPDTKARLQKYARRFRGKGVDAVWLQGRRPLTLLDLPVDILKDIVKEVTHTNDLTSLALCHSALHRLAIPHIYARFDIVWPDTSTHVEPRSGVDALTYGLATLVMAEEIFNRDSNEQRQPLISRNRFNYNGSGPASDLTVRKRRGNHYAQFTRKFSLGNGPPDWVSEYLIYKEGGKMLGTLVALALARMKSLETFVWDMPTGVLRDVWSSLASLGDYKDCRLEKVWVRWHDNSSGRRNMHATTSLPLMNLPGGPLAAAHPSTNAWTHAQRINPAALDHVEHPSFSELPPLKSLSVLDIDELVYLDEMAVLIGKSVEKLTELRVGIARHAGAFSWVTVAEEDGLQQVDYGRPSAASVTIGEKRLGGILGVLTGFVHDLRRPKSGTGDDEPSGTRSTGPRVAGSPFARAQSGTIYSPDTVSSAETTAADEEQAPVTLDTDTGSLAQELQALHVDDAVVLDKSTNSTPHATSPSAAPYRANDMLRLDILELERVPLSLLVLDRAIDWTRLTSLTLLHCQGHEMLWRTLRRTFEPVPKSPVYPRPRRSSASTPRRGSRVSHGGEEIEFVYGLNLKKIHINVVSTSLITFLKETLAPNSLEVLFLQEVRMGTPPVTIDSIFRGPLRRHRRSLKKLLIDSSVENHDGLLPASSRWRRWMLTRDIIGFICSGKMPVLQELGVTIDYRDWHFFLRSLPSIPHIRSLYIPYLAHHAHGADLDPRELALQILDIVALRPEVELCYMGVGTKCFEILQDRDDGSRSDGTPMGHRTESDMDDDDEDDVGLGDEDRDEDRDDDGDDDSTESDDDHGLDDNETESETGDDDSDGRGWPGLRLREILFYEDKVAIFKARHGRL